MRQVLTRAATVACLIPFAPAHAAAPALYTGWLEFRFSQAECMSRAMMAVRAVGMTKAFEVVGTSTFGEKGDYTGLIRCVEATKVAIFAVAGPLAPTAAELGKALDDEFRKIGPNRPTGE